MPSCNVMDNPYGQSERVLTCHWSTIEGESCMMSTADTSTASIDERSADAPSLSRQWNSIDWKEAEKNVRHIQGRISKAYSEGRTSLAKRVSYLLVNSFHVKALAVKRVSVQNKGNPPAQIRIKATCDLGLLQHRKHRSKRHVFSV